MTEKYNLVDLNVSRVICSNIEYWEATDEIEKRQEKLNKLREFYKETGIFTNPQLSTSKENFRLMEKRKKELKKEIKQVTGIKVDHEFDIEERILNEINRLQGTYIIIPVENCFNIK